MNIRQAGIEDIRDLSRLCMHVQRIHAEAYPDRFKLPERADFAVGVFKMFLADPNTNVFIAEDPWPVGYLVGQVVHREENPFTYAHSYLNIDQIGVDPEHRGKGIGKALMARAAELADEEGLPTITLNTWEFNREAHAFFRSQEYEMYTMRMWKR